MSIYCSPSFRFLGLDVCDWTVDFTGNSGAWDAATFEFGCTGIELRAVSRGSRMCAQCTERVLLYLLGTSLSIGVVGIDFKIGNNRDREKGKRTVDRMSNRQRSDTTMGASTLNKETDFQS